MYVPGLLEYMLNKILLLNTGKISLFADIFDSFLLSDEDYDPCLYKHITQYDGI